MSALDEAIRASAAAGAQAGCLAALRSPEGREIILQIVRAAIGPQLKRPAQVFEEFGIPESTQRHLRRKGLLKATKVGRTVLIDVSELRPYSPEEIAVLAAEARG